MIKFKTVLLIFSMMTILSCTQKLSDADDKKLEKNAGFWIHRADLIRKESTDAAYPVKQDSVLTEQRINRIYIDNMQCQFELFVDGVLLTKVIGGITEGGGGITGDYDINQLLLTSGKHEIKVRMYPQFGKTVFGKEGNVNLKFSHFTRETFKKPVYVAEMSGHNGIHIDQKGEQWNEKWDQENQVGYDGDYVAKQPEKFNGLPAYEWRRTFTAQVPFHLSGWLNSVDLKNEQDKEKKDIRKEVLEEYEKIHKLIAQRDIAGYLELIKEREELISQALYYKPGEQRIRKEDIVKLIKNADYEVEPLFEETFQLDYQGYGKLVTVISKIDGDGVIRLRNRKDPSDVVSLDLRFHRKNKNGKLSVI